MLAKRQNLQQDNQKTHYHLVYHELLKPSSLTLGLNLTLKTSCKVGVIAKLKIETFA
jgi:hypothetical protein